MAYVTNEISKNKYHYWVKNDDPDNLHCHSQEKKLVIEILAQEAIIVFKNSNILIEKLCHCSFCHFEKKTVLNFSHLPCHICHVTYMTLIQFIFSWLCNNFMKFLFQVLYSTAQLILELLIIIPIFKKHQILWIKNSTKMWGPWQFKYL